MHAFQAIRSELCSTEKTHWKAFSYTISDVSSSHRFHRFLIARNSCFTTREAFRESVKCIISFKTKPNPRHSTWFHSLPRLCSDWIQFVSSTDWIFAWFFKVNHRKMCWFSQLKTAAVAATNEEALINLNSKWKLIWFFPLLSRELARLFKLALVHDLWVTDDRKHLNSVAVVFIFVRVCVSNHYGNSLLIISTWKS